MRRRPERILDGRAHVAGVAVALALASGASPGRAADGEIEINQVRAQAGGITASDLPGFPVTIASPGSYRLTGELTPSGDASAIEILASDVSLRLGGFTVRGGKACSGVPPAISCPSGASRGITAAVPGTRISDGVVTGFAAGGIVLGEAASVSGVEAHHNGAVGIAVGERSRIARCQATRNGGPGFSIGDATLITESSSVGNQGRGAVLGADSAVEDSLLLDGPGSVDPVLCFADVFEPNDNEGTSRSLGTVPDADANGSSFDAELAGAGDADWFSFAIVDLAGGTPDPAISVTSGGALRTCVFYACSAGTTFVECPSGSTQTASQAGRPGCCTPGGALQLQVDCSPGPDESGLAVIRVDGGPVGLCSPYHLAWHP